MLLDGLRIRKALHFHELGSDTSNKRSQNENMAQEIKSAYKNAHFATKAIHVGQDPDPNTGAVTVPISLATTFAQASPGQHRVCRVILHHFVSSLLVFLSWISD